jgi:hypothetical protein
MSDFLTIDAIPVPIQAPFDEDDERAGEEFRLYNLDLASQVRAEKRRWSCLTGLLERAEVNALKAATALDAPVPVTFTIDGITETITARVRFPRQLQQTGLYLLRLDIREI